MKAFIGALIMLMIHIACFAQQGQDPSPDMTTVKPRSPNPWWQVYGFSAGVWLPQSKLNILGVHPTLGITGGLRNMNNEVDLDISFRFIRTPQDYLVKRGDSLYSLHYFFGGYIGVDYTRYVLFSRRWEFGALVGLGYDGFEIANESDDSGSYDYLRPLDIGCLNYNLGLRCNFYFKDGTFIGLIPRYHFLHYSNQGGSSLFGNAYSIELTVGSPF